MKKNVLLVSGLAGVILLAWAATFASTSNGTQAREGAMGPKMMGKMGMERWGQGMKGEMGVAMWIGSGNRVKMEAIKTAIQDNDYPAYKKAYTNAMMTKTEFAQAAKMHQNREAVQNAIQKNDFDAYIASAKGTPMENKVTQDQFKDMVAKHTQMTAMRDAVDNNDYSAYVAAVKGMPMEGKVTQEQFATMVQHQQQRGQKNAQ